jgi:hypothetical protein
MAQRSAVNVPGSIRVLAILVMAVGAVMVVAGAGTWFLVQSQLSDERITVSDDAAHFAGDAVDGPLTAYTEAETIEKHATKASGGKTYTELAPDDPTRNTVMTASFLRASLFTSVVSFGLAAMAGGLGIVLLLIGWALLSLASAVRAVAAATTDLPA